jgi:hypothetical protein
MFLFLFYFVCVIIKGRKRNRKPKQTEKYDWLSMIQNDYYPYAFTIMITMHIYLFYLYK